MIMHKQYILLIYISFFIFNNFAIAENLELEDDQNIYALKERETETHGTKSLQQSATQNSFEGDAYDELLIDGPEADVHEIEKQFLIDEIMNDPNISDIEKEEIIQNFRNQISQQKELSEQTPEEDIIIDSNEPTQQTEEEPFGYEKEVCFSFAMLNRACEEYKKQNKSYPISLQDLASADYVSFDPAIAEGRGKGYIYEIINSSFDEYLITAYPDSITNIDENAYSFSMMQDGIIRMDVDGRRIDSYGMHQDLPKHMSVFQQKFDE